MKYQNLIAVLTLALMAGACGQSHVEYNKSESTAAGGTGGNTPSSTLETGDDDGSDFNGPVDPAKLRVTSSSLMSSVGDMAHTWQEWTIPNRNGPGLSTSELESNGDFPTAEQQIDPRFEYSYKLYASSMRRCVYRNRNIPFESKTMAIVNQTEMMCIPLTGAIVNSSAIRLSVFVSPYAYDREAYVQLLGSSAKKTIPKSGRATLQIKMTARIGARQAFNGAAKETLPDDMDVLVSTHFVGQNPDPACGLERDFLYTITFENAKPVKAQVVVLTQQRSVQEFENFIATTPFLENSQTPDSARAPSFNTGASNACQSQHQAWIECAYGSGRTNLGASRTERCSPKVGKAIDKNFKALLRSSVTIDGQTHRLFFLSNDEANARNKQGVKSGLWHDDAVNPTDRNPLSVEDFQQFVDLIEMK